MNIIRASQKWDSHVSNLILLLDDQLSYVGSVEIQVSEIYKTTIVSMYIEEQYRGLGYSKIIMGIIIDEFGNDDLMLSVRDCNLLAIRLYEKYGFNFMDDDYDNNGFRYRWMKRSGVKNN